jgi:hypothetical protein
VTIFASVLILELTLAILVTNRQTSRDPTIPDFIVWMRGIHNNKPVEYTLNCGSLRHIGTAKIK